MNLTIEKQTAKKLYPDSPSWFREVLTETFGESFFKKKSFKDIKTMEDVYEALNVDPSEIFNSNDTTDEIAYKKMKLMVKAINPEGWFADWDNSNQRKWWPWFKLSSGFGFVVSTYYYGHTNATVGSRLCTDSREKVLYIAEQFKDLYQDYFLYSE